MLGLLKIILNTEHNSMCRFVINQVTKKFTVVAHHVLQHAAEVPVQTSILIQQYYTHNDTTANKLQTANVLNGFQTAKHVTFYQISFETKI